MLPVIAGEKTTKINILIYSLLMLPVVVAPFIFNFASLFYLSATLLMTLYYNYLCFSLFKEKLKKHSNKIARRVFLYSIFYLFLIYGLYVFAIYLYEVQNLRYEYPLIKIELIL